VWAWEVWEKHNLVPRAFGKALGTRLGKNRILMKLREHWGRIFLMKLLNILSSYPLQVFL